MDAGGGCGKRFQVPERSGDTETLFLCASAPEFHSRGGLVYPNAAEPGDHGDDAGARSARAGPGPGALRGDHAAGAGGPLDIAAVGGRNSGWRFSRVGAAARCHRTLWRDVAWLDVDSRRRVARRRRSTRFDALTWEPPVQGKPARPAGLRVGTRGDDDRLAGSVFFACTERGADRSCPGVARLILHVRTLHAGLTAPCGSP